MNKVDKEKTRRASKNAVDGAVTEGRIAAWQHTIVLCRACIKAHKEILMEIRRRGKEGR